MRKLESDLLQLQSVCMCKCDVQADAQVEMEKRGFYQASMKYVLKLQEAQERKKFEFVEIVSVA